MLYVDFFHKIHPRTRKCKLRKKKNGKKSPDFVEGDAAARSIRNYKTVYRDGKAPESEELRGMRVLWAPPPQRYREARMPAPDSSRIFSCADPDEASAARVSPGCPAKAVSGMESADAGADTANVQAS